MTAKISVFVVVLIAACASTGFANEDPTTTSSLYGIPNPNFPNIPYYPSDTMVYNEFKKALYTVNQALSNVCFTAQSAYDYFSLYKKDQQLYNTDMSAKTAKFEKSLNYFDNVMKKYRQALLDYKLSLKFQPTTSPMSDDILLNPDLLM